MSLRLHTAPTVAAISLVDMKLHLRVDDSAEDALITALIDAATASAEHIMGRAIMPQKWQLLTDSFSDLSLNMPKVTAVDSVKYIDTTGALLTIDPSLYQSVLGSDYGAFITVAYGQTFPVNREIPESVQVIFSCGYADAASVPSAIIAWIKLCVAALYENRQLESGMQTHSLGIADCMLDRYRTYSA